MWYTFLLQVGGLVADIIVWLVIDRNNISSGAHGQKWDPTG